jgi:hypothetical protein
MTLALFGVGEYYPPLTHKKRIARYKENKKLFLGKHYDVFVRVQSLLSKRQNEIVYVSANLPGIICKKSADFLFGESPGFSAGKESSSPEQKALERLVEDNELNITNYESSLGNSYRGDSFYKVRWGQYYEGVVDKEIDPFRVFIESQNPEYVFPETMPGDANKILAYHIAYPVPIILDENQGTLANEWLLYIESHYPGVIKYSKWVMLPSVLTSNNEITEWRLSHEVFEARREVKTGVIFPLVVHVPNFSTDDGWDGIDDLTDLKPIFDEINNRLSQIAVILDKHADPAIAVPAGTIDTDEEGNPVYRVGIDKVFEIMGKDDVIPQYITWDGQLSAAFLELEKLLDILLVLAEVPSVALGQGDSGTSGSSGLSIKWRMNSLLAKVNRKRQYYEKGLRRVLLTAQMLEKAQLGKVDYEVTVPKIKFNDGLPDDEMEHATIYQIRTGGKATVSQKTAIMEMDGLTEEQADAELKRIQDEEAVADPSIFNNDTTDLTDQEDSGEGDQ